MHLPWSWGTPWNIQTKSAIIKDRDTDNMSSNRMISTENALQRPKYAGQWRWMFCMFHLKQLTDRDHYMHMFLSVLPIWLFRNFSLASQLDQTLKIQALQRWIFGDLQNRISPSSQLTDKTLLLKTPRQGGYFTKDSRRDSHQWIGF